MKCLLVVCAVFILHAVGNPVPETELKIYENKLRPDGYHYLIITKDDLVQGEKGTIDGKNLDVKGLYIYTLPDGSNVEVNYSAGAKGYLAKFHFQNSLVPQIRRRIPTAAICSLIGGGCG